MNFDGLTQNIVTVSADFWSKIALFLPNVLAAVLIFVVGILLARLVGKWSAALLKKAGLDRLCSRIGIDQALNKVGSDKSASDLVAKFIYFFMVLIVLLTAVETLGLDRVTSILDDFILYLPKIVGALIVVVIGMFIAHTVKQGIGSAFQNMEVEYASSVARLAQIIIYVTTFSLAVGQLEIETQMLNIVFAIVLGSLGIGAAISLGLGTRSVSNNIIAGVYIREQLQAGDSVTIEDFKGVVVSVGTVSTVIENDAGECLSVPNRTLLSSNYRFQSWSDDE